MQIKYIFLFFLTFIFSINSISFAEEVNSVSPKKQSMIFDLGGGFGKYDIKSNKNKITNLNNKMNIGVTYFYNLNTMSNMFSIGGKFISSSYGEKNIKTNTDKTLTSLGSTALFIVGNANIYNIGNFSSNLNAGLGISLNALNVKYTNQNQTIDNTDGRATLAYTVGVNEIYNINSSWGVGLNVNYTNLGTAQTKYKYSGISSTIKAKPQNNDFGVGLSVKYSF